MRILFFGKRYYTNQDAAAQQYGRIYQLPLAWHRYGHKVCLALCDYRSLQSGNLSKHEFFVRSLSAIDPRSVSELNRLARAQRPDVVVASGDCFVGLLGLRVARANGAKFVFDVYDDYRTFGAYKAFLGWDALGFLCKRADLTMYASTVMAEAHGPDTPSILVPNGVDEARFVPAPIGQARNSVGLCEQGPLVGYFGSMTREHGVNELIKALRVVRRSYPKARLLLCGKRHPATSIVDSEVLYRGVVPHHEIPAYLNACDVLALPYLNGAFLDKASSCKIAEYLFCRRPIVATRTPNFVRNFPEQARLLDGRLVAPGDADALGNAILQQLDDPIVPEPPGNMTWRWIAGQVARRLEHLVGA